MNTRLGTRRLVVAALTSLSVLAGATPAQAAHLSPVIPDSRTQWQTNSRVDDIAYVGDVAYIVGRFNEVRAPRTALGDASTQTRRFAAAFNTATRQLLPWNPDPDRPLTSVEVSPDGATVYLGGEFTTVRGVSRSRVAAVDAVNGWPTAWNPNVVAPVRAMDLSVDGSLLYVGGPFRKVNGQVRERLAALKTADNKRATQLAPLDTQILYSAAPSKANVRALALSPDGQHLYVGGVFKEVQAAGQTAVARDGAVKLSVGTGAVDPNWDPKIIKKDNKNETEVYEYAFGGGKVFICGDFYAVNVTKRSPNLAAVSPVTGAIVGDSWWNTTDGAVNACTASDTHLYIGGHFDWAGGKCAQPNLEVCAGDNFTGLDRQHIAAFDLVTGETDDWDPRANSVPGVYALTVAGGKLGVGGDFNRLGWRTPTCRECRQVQHGFGQFDGTP